ncbi:MAG TPA: DUF4350 domain-containing protein [Pyrinomonadaceae bacterium]
MRQRLAIIITLLVVVIVLVGLNAASYVRVEDVSDSESSPDRSTFNSGATGSRALYDFLRESQHQVVRWREPSSTLLSFNGPKPATFVIIGPTQVPYSKRESVEVRRWVALGGRLVIIDRSPNKLFLSSLKNWTLKNQLSSYPWYDLDPNNFEQMTMGVKAIQPSQPTSLALNVESVMPSRFMGRITITPTKAEQTKKTKNEDTATDTEDYESAEDSDEPYHEAPAEAGPQAPVVHLTENRGDALLLDYPYGKGRIVVLTDPYIVANNGIGRADNLLLAINVVAGGGGMIAFDEFHQGRATTQNAIIHYFSGTPVLAIGAQLALIGLAMIWSRGRRFGRPLPLPHVDRRSKLEFVASMAELQQRAKAHDLALENIYGRVRRVLVRHAGLSNISPRAEIARRVAERSGINRDELETLMRNCEDTINGAPTNARESLRMVKRLREIQSRLGLGARSRDARQEGK